MKTLFFLGFLFLSVTIFAQTEGNKFQFYSISIAPGIYFDFERNNMKVTGPSGSVAINNSNGGGLSGSIDLAFKKGEHRFKIFVMSASEVSLFGDLDDSYVEYDILYGRELFLTNWFYIDFYVGVGYYRYNIKVYLDQRITRITKEAIGFPLQSRIRFQLGDVFGLGIQLHTNLNSASIIYHTGIFFQWKF